MFVNEINLKIVKDILKNIIPDCEVWAFGSRVHGKNLKKFSDLDLVIFSEKNLSIDSYLKLKEAFSESDLPFRVDISEWKKLDENFKKIIKSDYKIIQNKKN